MALLLILSLFVIEYRREMFLIDRFEVNDDKIDDNLKRHVFSRNKYLDLERSLTWSACLGALPFLSFLLLLHT